MSLAPIIRTQTNRLPDIFVNAIYLSSKIPPFIDAESLAVSSRNLSVVCDVSCDTTNP
jgi:saccharopine dehydrogenase (NAD+, L-lysine-forming)